MPGKRPCLAHASFTIFVHAGRMVRRAFPILILVLVGVAALFPSFLWGPGATHSHQYNYMWTAHFGEQMAAGHLYERWLPRSFEGLGSPTFYFYPPLAYWITGGIHALGASIFQSINLGGLLLVLGSGLSMYAWLAERGTRPLTGAILYMLAPYHLYDFYVRGALAEMTAFLWLPLIALAISWLPRRRGMLLLAASYAGLLIGHLPLALLTGLFLMAPLVVARIWRDRSSLPPAILGSTLAVLLAAFYLLPAMTLQDEVSTAMLWGTDYRASEWSIWTSSFELFPCLALALILLAWPARSIWTGIAVVTALASVGLIPFLWHISVLDKVQFPWRAFCIVEFAAVTALMQYRPRPLILAATGVLLLFPYAFGGLLGAAFLRKPVDYALIERIEPDAPEYLPAGFDLSRVRENDHWTDVSRWRDLPRGDHVRVQRDGPVVLGRSAFPIWRVMRDGEPVPSDGPLVHFDARPGVYHIERVTIWQERWGAAISLAGLMLLMLSLVLPRAISLLSKFPAYSPLPALSDRPYSGGLGRSRASGGEL